MWLLVVFSLAGVGGVIRALVEHRPTGELVLAIVLTVICAALFFWIRAQRARSQAFATWIIAHGHAINAGTATYDGRPLRRETPLRAYSITVSLVALTLREPTAPYVGESASWGPRLLCTFATLIVGWWGLPWGPIMTLQTVIKNLRGGDLTTVGKLLDGAVRAAQIAAARAAADRVAAQGAKDLPKDPKPPQA